MKIDHEETKSAKIFSVLLRALRFFVVDFREIECKSAWLFSACCGVSILRSAEITRVPGAADDTGGLLPFRRNVVYRDQIGVTLVTPSVEAFQEDRHQLQQRGGAMTGQSRRVREASGGRAYEEAALVDRERPHVVSEGYESVVLKQVLLHVRRVKGRHREAVFPQIIAYSPERLLAAEITDDGDDQILAVQVSHEIIVLTGGEIIAELTIEVSLCNQVLQRGKVPAPRVVHSVGDVKSVFAEVAVDVFQTLQIVHRERELKLILNRLADRGQIGHVGLFIRGGLVENGEDLMYRSVGLRGLILRRRPAKQSGKKLDAIRRKMEDRLVHQVLDYRLAPNVHNECDLRADLGDVGEILLRSHSEISSA